MYNDIKLSENMATVNGKRINLTNQESALLKTLLENEGKTLSRAALLEKAWGYKSAGITRTVDVHIQRLRKKIGTHLIDTVYRGGYKLNIVA